MKHLMNLYEMTPPAMVFLFAVMFLIYGFLLWWLLGKYYGRSFRRAAEAMYEEYQKALEQQKAKYRGQV